ncbi:MAG: FkbM family methyltransferase [Deltaproteobacteria bacterium]|nr:FkbM family methyltransferase [Deltaproteobacteria bacterium]
MNKVNSTLFEHDTDFSQTSYYSSLKRVPAWLKTHVDRYRNDPFFREVSNEKANRIRQYVRGKAYKDNIDLAEYQIELWLDDNIDFLIWLYGYYEIHESRMFLSLLKPDNVVVDVGANIGYYSLLAASRTGNGGKVFAFEPVPLTFFRLKKNVQRIECVEALQMACGDEDGFTEIYISDFRVNGQSGCSRILSPLPNNPNIKEKVPLIRLDTFFGGKKQTKIDLMKIDTEGYELKVLMGSENILRDNKDIKILLEMNEKYIRMCGSTPEDFFDYLEGFGLHPWRLVYTEASKWIFQEDNGFQGNRSLHLFSRNYPISHT